jgi:hypothetical protein
MHIMNRPEFTTDQIRLERRLPSYWRVTFDMPPVNIFGPKEMPLLNDIITAIETDPQVKVVVFDSAVEGFFITHYDFLAPLEDSLSIPPGAAAHAGCFTMALAFRLQIAGYAPAELSTEAAVTLEPEGKGLRISKSALTLRAKVPNLDDTGFARIAG